MTDPSRVNDRIAALMESEGYWADPRALAEAASLWGGGADEHGVFRARERIEVARRTPAAGRNSSQPLRGPPRAFRG